MSIDAIVYFIMGLAYVALAVLACYVGSKLRDRCKRQRLRFWIFIVTIFVAVTLMLMATFSFYGLKEIQKPTPKHKIQRVEV